jgi:hypothetical protein
MADLKDNYRYLNITTATTTQVTSNQGQLIKIIVNKATASTIAYIDGTGSTPIGTMKASMPEGSYEILATFTQGLKIVTGGSPDLTIVYSSIGA